MKTHLLTALVATTLTLPASPAAIVAMAEKPKPPATAPIAATAATLKLEQHPTPAINLRLVEHFRQYVGLRETPLGSNRGPLIDQFNRAAAVDLGSPWCASVTHYGHAQFGLPARGAYSPSWFVKSRVIPRDDAQPGDVGLIYFPSKGRYAHTIAAIESTRTRGSRVVEFITLEGNTNAQGSREGDGFFRRIRPADTVVAVRWWR
jgi:hypothetical protein